MQMQLSPLLESRFPRGPQAQAVNFSLVHKRIPAVQRFWNAAAGSAERRGVNLRWLWVQSRGPSHLPTANCHRICMGLYNRVTLDF